METPADAAAAIDENAALVKWLDDAITGTQWFAENVADWDYWQPGRVFVARDHPLTTPISVEQHLQYYSPAHVLDSIHADRELLDEYKTAVAKGDGVSKAMATMLAAVLAVRAKAYKNPYALDDEGGSSRMMQR